MSVKFAILGLLLKRPSYPYELSVYFEKRIGLAWRLNRGQVYQTVYRLEEERLVERTSAKTNSPHGIRWIYRVTELGREQYDQWRRSTSEQSRPLRDDLLLRIALAMPEDANHLLRMIDQRERVCAERLQEYTEFEATLVPLEEARSWQEVGPTLSTSAALAQLDAELGWLNDARNALTRLRDQATPALADTAALQGHQSVA